MNEACKVNVVRKSTLKFAIFFTLVGVMMIFLIPTLTEKAEAYTRGDQGRSLNVHFSNLKWQLEQGKWVIEPHFLTAGFTQYIIWATKGSGFFGVEIIWNMLKSRFRLVILRRTQN